MHLPIKIQRSILPGLKNPDRLSSIDSLQEKVYNIVVKNLSHTDVEKQVKFLYKSVTVKVGTLSVWRGL